MRLTISNKRPPRSRNGLVRIACLGRTHHRRAPYVAPAIWAISFGRQRLPRVGHPLQGSAISLCIARKCSPNGSAAAGRDKVPAPVVRNATVVVPATGYRADQTSTTYTASSRRAFVKRNRTAKSGLSPRATQPNACEAKRPRCLFQ